MIAIRKLLIFIFVLGFVFQLLSQEFTPDEHTLGLWHFNENPGATSVIDASGNSLHGQVNAVSWYSGVYGNALDLTGINDYVIIEDTDILSELGANYTFEFWLLIDEYQNAKSILAKWGTGGREDDEYNFYINLEGTITCALSGLNDSEPFHSKSKLPRYQWNHIMLTADSQKNATSLYINGILDTLMNKVVVLDRNTVEPFYIGRATGTGNNFNGLLDELRISTIAREVTVENMPLFPAFYDIRESSGAAGIDSVYCEGVAMGDLNNDGLSDVYVTTTRYQDHFFLNNGDMTFTDVHAELGLNPDQHYNIALADFNNDTKLDLLVTGHGEALLRARLYRNDGNLSFTEISRSVLPDTILGFKALWGDLNNDGLLDIISSKYVFFQNGLNSFTDVTPILNIPEIGSEQCHPQLFDSDNDGDLDIIVIIPNDKVRLYENTGNQDFRDITASAGLPVYSDNYKDAAIGDIDNDGDFDIYMALSGDNILFRNDGNNIFTDISAISHTANTGANEGFGKGTRSAAFADVNNDGFLDLYASNFKQGNSLFINLWDNTFKDVGQMSGTLNPVIGDGGPDTIEESAGHGVSFGDINNDGHLDLYLANSEDVNPFYLNNGVSEHKWLQIKLIGNVSNSFGLGAKIYVDTGEQVLLREPGREASQGCQNATPVHFGLNKSLLVDEVKVVWPSGLENRLTNVQPNQIITISEPELFKAVEFNPYVEMAHAAFIQVETEEIKAPFEIFLHYRKAHESVFLKKLMVENDGAFRAEIPETHAGSKGLEFFVEAVIMNTKKIKTNIHSFPVYIPANELEQTIRNDRYNLISIPLNANDKSVETLLVDDLGKPDSSQWRLWDIDPNRADTMFPYREYPNVGELFPGNAMFLITKSDLTLTAGDGTTVNSIERFGIPLQPGWNMISSPFDFKIPKTNVYPENLRSQLYAYGDSAWTTEFDSLQAWSGYMLKVNEAVTLQIEPQVYPMAASQALTKQTVHPDWFIRVAAKCGNAQDYDNVAGVSALAKPEWDIFERFEPPPIGDYVMLSFPHRDWQKYRDIHATDFRPAGESGYVWDFEVSSSLARKEVELKFSNLKSMPDGFAAVLYDPDLTIRQELLQDSTYRFVSLSEAKRKRFQLLAGTQEFISGKTNAAATIPEKFELYQNFPNPFNPTTTIIFGLPEAGTVSLKIYNVLGQEVSRLLSNEFKPSGFHFINWDAKDISGNQVSSGMYLVQITVGKKVLTRKMILLR